MTEISEAAKRKACDLANVVVRERGGSPGWEPCDVPDFVTLEALARVLQEHSDVAKDCLNAPPLGPERKALLRSLILPDEPDPVFEELALALAGLVPEIDRRCCEGFNEAVARQLLAELATRGKALKIVEADSHD